MSESSIRRKLVVNLTLTTGFALALSSLVFGALEITRFRDELVRRTSVLAEVVGFNSVSALLFDDPQTVESVLRALAAEKQTVAAVVYDREGRPFAHYLAEGRDSIEAAARQREGHEFSGDSLDLYRDIVVDGEVLGTVFVRSDTRELAQRIWRHAAIAAAVMAAASLVAWFAASRLREQIATPLVALARGSAAMAGGDLSTRVRVSSDDEIGALGVAFNGMAESLRALISQVGDSMRAVTAATGSLEQASQGMLAEAGRQEEAVEGTTESIEKMRISTDAVNANVEALAGTATETSNAAGEVDGAIANIAARMDDLSATIDLTASSVVEMTTAICEIAQSAEALGGATDATAASVDLLKQSAMQVEANAEHTHTLSERAAEQADRGLRSVEETIASMNEIHVGYGGLEQVIDRLAEKSKSIGEIVVVIEEVVAQTKLLHLNAAIIASGAGEAGRPFSVVASEIKNLADRTEGSTRQIAELVEGVQEEVNEAVSAMSEGASDIEKGVALTAQSGAMLRGIRESSQQSTSAVREIAEAARNQARSIEQVDTAMLQVREIAQVLERSTREQDAATAEISLGVDRMRELGRDVKCSTQEQKKESRLISEAVNLVAMRIAQIVDATGDQGKQGEQILEALHVFREVTAQSLRRAKSVQDIVEVLSERYGELQAEIGRFNV